MAHTSGLAVERPRCVRNHYCKLYGASIIFLSNARRAPVGKHACYSRTKCSKLPPRRINKQGGIAESWPGCCVDLVLAEPFSPWQRGAQLSFGDAAQPFFTAWITETHITPCKYLETETMTLLHVHKSWAQAVQEHYKEKMSLQQVQQLPNNGFFFSFSEHIHYLLNFILALRVLAGFLAWHAFELYRNSELSLKSI